MRGGRKARQQASLAATTAPASFGTASLNNPFPQMNLFSDDYISAMHEKALDILETMGIKMLLPEARQYLKSAGARVDDAAEMVFIGRELVEAALATAPRS